MVPSKVVHNPVAQLEYMKKLREISEGVQTCDICKGSPVDQVLVSMTRYGKMEQVLQQTLCFMCVPCQRRVTRILNDLLFAVQY